MTRWEHHRVGPHPGPDFDVLGRQGWEFVAVILGGQYLFKRLMAEPSP